MIDTNTTAAPTISPGTNDSFRALAEAAMRCATQLVAAMTPDTAEAVHHATTRGGRLLMEFGPLPAFEAVTLLLVEPEGQRHALGSIQVRTAPPH